MIEKIYYLLLIIYMIKIIKKSLNFLNSFKPSIKQLLNNYGDNYIKNIYICRKPINDILRKTLNFISIGNFENNIDKLNYDKIFHLFIICVLDDVNLLIEKNERINIMINNIDLNNNDIDKLNVDLKNQNIKLNEFIYTGLKFMGDDNFFKYSSYKYNCQNFIYNLLLSNNLMNSEYEKFILQDIKTLFNNMGYIKPISDVLTNIGAIGNYIYNGGELNYEKNYKLHTILFNKKYFNKENAIKWLKQNNYKYSIMRNQKNFYRFQQLGNNYIKNKYGVKYYFTIKSKDFNGIEYIIGYN